MFESQDGEVESRREVESTLDLQADVALSSIASIRLALAIQRSTRLATERHNQKSLALSHDCASVCPDSAAKEHNSSQNPARPPYAPQHKTAPDTLCDPALGNLKQYRADVHIQVPAQRVERRRRRKSEPEQSRGDTQSEGKITLLVADACQGAQRQWPHKAERTGEQAHGECQREIESGPRRKCGAKEEQRERLHGLQLLRRRASISDQEDREIDWKYVTAGGDDAERIRQFLAEILAHAAQNGETNVLTTLLVCVSRYRGIILSRCVPTTTTAGKNILLSTLCNSSLATTATSPPSLIVTSFSPLGFTFPSLSSFPGFCTGPLPLRIQSASALIVKLPATNIAAGR